MFLCFSHMVLLARWLACLLARSLTRIHSLPSCVHRRNEQSSRVADGMVYAQPHLIDAIFGLRVQVAPAIGTLG